MSYPYFGQTGQGVTSVPPSNQPANVQQVSTSTQQNQPFMMNQFQNPMGQSLFPTPTGSVYSLNTASDIGNVPAGVGISVGLCLRTRYSVCVHTNISTGVFKLLGKIPCSQCSNYLASLPAPAVATAPTQAAAPASEVAVNSIQKGADK